MKKTARLLTLLLALVFLTGCAAALLGVGAGVGIGAYKYIEGNLVRYYPLTYARAWNATNKALANLRISVSDSLNEGTRGTIHAVRKDGVKLTIRLKEKGLKVTSISVRVGLLGDRKAAERVHDEIAAVVGL